MRNTMLHKLRTGWVKICLLAITIFILAGVTGQSLANTGISPRPGLVTGWGLSVPPPFVSETYLAISAGGGHNLALKYDGTVVAWGCSGVDYGQCTVPAGLDEVVAISAGAEHNLALKDDGTVVAWGDNFRGQTTVPAGLGGVLAISAGGAQNLVLIRYPHSVYIPAVSKLIAP
jgi:hypothetical protein